MNMKTEFKCPSGHTVKAADIHSTVVLKEPDIYQAVVFDCPGGQGGPEMITKIKPKTGRIIVHSVDGKRIGTIEGGIFTKVITAPDQRLLEPPGWAVDKLAFDRKVRPNAGTFRIIDIPARMIYESSIEYFDQMKKELDRGFGKQYFMPLLYWQARATGQEKMI